MVDGGQARSQLGGSLQPRLRVGLLLALLGLALVLQGVAAARMSFWEDEAWTATIARTSPAEIVRAVAEDRHPPLYFLLAGGWARLFGTEELGLRSLSIIFCLLAMWAAYRLGRRLYGESAGLVGVALLVFSPFVLMYGHAARYYALAAWLSIEAVNLFLDYLDQGRVRPLAGYVVCGLALLYTAYTAAGVLLALNLWWLWERLRRRGTVSVIAWFAAQAVIVAGFIPWLPVLAGQAGEDLRPAGEAVNWLVEIGKRAAYLGYVYPVGETLSLLRPPAWLGLAAFGGMAWLALRSARGRGWLPLVVFGGAACTGILAAVLVAYPMTGWQGVPNRTFFALPFLLLWIVGWLAGRDHRAWLPLVLLGVYVLGMANYFGGREFTKPFLTVPWREIMLMVRDGSPAPAALVCGAGDYACGYYARRYGVEVYAPAEWERVEAGGYATVWWAHTNLGEAGMGASQQAEATVTASGRYAWVEQRNYARQDDDLRRLKAMIPGQNDYEYRLVLYRFERVIVHEGHEEDEGKGTTKYMKKGGRMVHGRHEENGNTVSTKYANKSGRGILDW